MIKPASYPRIKALNDHCWEVDQDFTRLGRVVTVRAWGFSRQDAIKALERAKEWQDQPSPEPFKALFGILWDAAGRIDSLIRLLACIKARLMTGKYD